MSHNLPDLPYSYDALVPFIDTQTMEIHHQKHHAAYISKLNGALEGHADLQGKDVEHLVKSLESLPESIRMNDFQYTLATGSSGRPSDGGYKQVDFMTVEMSGEMTLQGNLLVFPTP